MLVEKSLVWGIKVASSGEEFATRKKELEKEGKARRVVMLRRRRGEKGREIGIIARCVLVFHTTRQRG